MLGFCPEEQHENSNENKNVTEFAPLVIHSQARPRPLLNAPKFQRALNEKKWQIKPKWNKKKKQPLGGEAGAATTGRGREFVRRGFPCRCISEAFNLLADVSTTTSVSGVLEMAH